MNKNKKKGFTLIEVLVAATIFTIISTGIYTGFLSIMKVMNVIRVKGIMTNIANEQFEIMRNLSYDNLGTINGIPSGVLSQSQTLNRDNKEFTVNITIRNYDDPFDGTFNGIPKDLSPADMKQIEVSILCLSCKSNISPISLTTIIAPKNLETASVNGALIVRVFDAAGLPVPGVNVNIINNILIPNINLNELTDVNGVLTIVDAPPSVDGYQIIVSKDGYSTDRTYAVGENGNLNPSKPNITVVVQQISQISFAIDLVSTINVSSINNLCAPISNFDFNISGNKLIGSSPDILKNSSDFITDTLGKKILNNIEWDTYNIIGSDLVNDIIGTNPLLSIGINPNIEQDLEIITTPKNGRRLLVVVRDQSTGLPITDAIVTLTGPNNYLNSFITNEGFINQTDWSGGAGQELFLYANKYLDSDGNIDDTLSVGNLSLMKIIADYAPLGYLTSSTFDIGASTNFKQISWTPETEPIETGALSVRFQIATNNDELTWNFIGPDGTSSTYYSSLDKNINLVHNGDRYIRYRLYLSTSNTAFTPIISDISIMYTSSCIPPGQVSFASLSLDTYTITVEKTGYQSVSRDVLIEKNWTKEEFIISP